MQQSVEVAENFVWKLGLKRCDYELFVLYKCSIVVYCGVD